MDFEDEATDPDQGNTIGESPRSASLNPELRVPDRAAGPARGSSSQPPAERFVFFPEPPDAAAPLYHELPVVLQGQALRTPPRLSRLRLGAAGSLPKARALATKVKAARSSFQKRINESGVAGWRLRSSLLARHPRVWGFGLLGTAAVAAGFVAGSIYLRMIDSPGRVSPTAVAERPASEPAAPPTPAPILAPAVLVPAPLPQARVEPPPDAAAPLAGSHPAPAPSRSAEIPDTEVTTRRVPQNAVARPNRPSVVAVRGLDRKGSSSVTTPHTVRGSLLVKSEPQGAQVSLNGVVQGRTPLVIRDLGAGTRVVRLDLPGYQRWSWAVPIVANKRTPVVAKLQAEPGSSRQPD